MLATVFYDDFPVLEYSDMSNASTLLLNTLLDLLGWQHAVVGKKGLLWQFWVSSLNCPLFFGELLRCGTNLVNRAHRGDLA